MVWSQRPETTQCSWDKYRARTIWCHPPSAITHSVVTLLTVSIFISVEFGQTIVRAPFADDIMLWYHPITHFDSSYIDISFISVELGQVWCAHHLVTLLHHRLWLYYIDVICTAHNSNRNELGCTSPLTSRFPSALEMSLGFALWTSLRPQEISRSSGM